MTPPRSRKLHRFLRRLLRSTRGAVFAELVVMLPFFILVWASIIFVHKYYSDWIRAGSHAKACAWQYSNGGCRDVPAGCGAPLSISAGSDLETSDIAGGSALDTLAHTPIINGIVSLVLGKNASVTGTGSVNPPAPLGTRGVGYTVRNTVMCNEIPRTPADLAHDAFCGLTRLCH